MCTIFSVGKRYFFDKFRRSEKVCMDVFKVRFLCYTYSFMQVCVCIEWLNTLKGRRERGKRFLYGESLNGWSVKFLQKNRNQETKKPRRFSAN